MSKKEKETKNSVDKSVTTFLNSVNKEFGEGSMVKLGDSPKQNIKKISSTSLLIDDALGGGYPVGRIVEIYGGEASGKAQPLSELVLTPFGYKQMKDLKKGSPVMHPNGVPTRVVDVFPQGRQLVYRIVFDDYSYTRSTLDHLWEVYDYVTHQKSVKELKDILKDPSRYYIKNANSMNFAETEVPESYLLWATGVTNGDVRFYELDNEYIYGDQDYRSSLLEYILDMSIKKTQNQLTYEYIVPSSEGVKLVKFLARSLGYGIKTSQISDKEVTIVKELSQPRRILDVIFDGAEECQCIKVEHPDGLYVTKDFITTHNTTLALGAVTSVQKAGGRAAYIDMEHAINVDYAEQLGVDIENLFLAQPSNAEEALDIAERAVQSKMFGIVVIDSVSALVPKKELEGGAGDSVMGLQARLMSQACRKLTGIANTTGTMILFINQTREKIGIVYGNPETTSGGNALKFYASQRVQTRRGAPIKTTDNVQIGHELNVTIVKNKVAAPFKKTVVNLIYGKGFDRISEIVDLAVQKEVITRKGSWYSYDGTNLGQGVHGVVDAVRDNPELLDELQQKVGL